MKKPCTRNCFVTTAKDECNLIVMTTDFSCEFLVDKFGIGL